MKINTLLKSTLFAFVAIILSGNTRIFAQEVSAPHFSWLQSIRGGFISRSTAFASDQEGNIYNAGSFESEKLTLGQLTLTNEGSFQQWYITKLDKAGNVLWLDFLSKSMVDTISALATDAIGNLVVAGTFSRSSLKIKSLTVFHALYGGTFIPYTESFLAKFNSSGVLLWVKTIQSLGPEESAGGNAIAGMCIDSVGNIAITGGFGAAKLSFGDVVLEHSDPKCIRQAFVAKYSPDGSALWATSDTTGRNAFSNDEMGSAISSGAQDELFVGIRGTRSGIQAFSKDGVFRWSKVVGACCDLHDESGLEAVRADQHGNVYFAGEYRDRVTYNDRTALAGF